MKCRLVAWECCERNLFWPFTKYFHDGCVNDGWLWKQYDESGSRYGGFSGSLHIPRRREGGNFVLVYTRKKRTFVSFRLLNTESYKPLALIIFTKSSLKYKCSTYLFSFKGILFLSLIDYFVMDSHTLSYIFQISYVDIVKKLLGTSFGLVPTKAEFVLLNCAVSLWWIAFLLSRSKTSWVQVISYFFLS